MNKIAKEFMVQPIASDVDRAVGQRIQQKRKELGYTAERLSEYVDISQPQLSLYERGTNKINRTFAFRVTIVLPQFCRQRNPR